jgi:hypothetical protein
METHTPEKSLLFNSQTSSRHHHWEYFPFPFFLQFLTPKPRGKQSRNTRDDVVVVLFFLATGFPRA